MKSAVRDAHKRFARARTAQQSHTEELTAPSANALLREHARARARAHVYTCIYAHVAVFACVSMFIFFYEAGNHHPPSLNVGCANR